MSLYGITNYFILLLIAFFIDFVTLDLFNHIWFGFWVDEKRILGYFPNILEFFDLILLKFVFFAILIGNTQIL